MVAALRARIGRRSFCAAKGRTLVGCALYGLWAGCSSLAIVAVLLVAMAAALLTRLCGRRSSPDSTKGRTLADCARAPCWEDEAKKSSNVDSLDSMLRMFETGETVSYRVS